MKSPPTKSDLDTSTSVNTEKTASNLLKKDSNIGAPNLDHESLKSDFFAILSKVQINSIHLIDLDAKYFAQGSQGSTEQSINIVELLLLAFKNDSMDE